MPAGAKRLSPHSLPDTLIISAAKALALPERKQQSPAEKIQAAKLQKAEFEERLRQIAEQKKAQEEYEKTSLIQGAAKLPKRGRHRLRALVKLSAQEFSILANAELVTDKDRESVQRAKNTSVLMTAATELLGVRASDIDRWDEDGRLPHAYDVHFQMHGKWILGRAWIMDDIDYASQHALAWLTDDLAKKRIRSTPKLQQQVDRLRARPATYRPGQAREQQAIQKAAEAQAQKERIAEQDEKLRMIYTEKQVQKQKLQAASDQRISQILSLAGDRHWSRIFPNPQLGARHLEAYLGPTNSGKTYQSLQALKSLKAHEHGVYLAPLRLLAIEVCEELRSQGVAASLVTGEERDIDPQARVVCSTIEMLDPSQHYTVGVIDEMQMIADTQRGWAWTQALFEMSADRLFVLGSPSVESLLKDFAETTGDTLTLHRTQRFNPLQVKPQPIAPKSVQPGTIFVVFSRNSVIRWGEYFRGNGYSVAQIYGAMPPEVRREEARRFRTGEADILVSTDAVAMGLNLPAHTVVLGEGEKYNGQTSTAVPKPLVRQIAGRAGRYGHHDAGFAAGSDSAIHRHMQSALNGQDEQFTFPMPNVAPTRQWVENAMELAPETTVRDLLTAWQQTVRGSRWFRCVDLSEILEKAHVLDSIEGSDRLPMAERLQILTAPADIRAGQLHHFRTMVTAIVENRTLTSPASGAGPHARTEDLESAYKHLSLYCWFHYRYPQAFPEIGKAVSERSRCVAQLITHIRQGLKRHCKSCGKVLPAKGTYGICESCYQAQRRQRQWDRDDDYY
ncbi:MAG: helicase-related protein [Acidithiobacillus sp.]